MSASDQNLNNVHINDPDGHRETVRGITEDEVDELLEDGRLGDVEIEDSRDSYGVVGVTADSVGSVRTPLQTQGRSVTIQDSDIDNVRGDLQGRNVLKDSEIGVIEGDVSFSKQFAQNTDNIELYGSLLKKPGRGSGIDGAFTNSHLPTVIGEEVDVEYLDRESVGGLVIADELSVGKTDGDMFTVAPNSSRGSHVDEVFRGDVESGHKADEWEEFKDEVKERSDEIYGVKIFAQNHSISEDRNQVEYGEILGEVTDGRKPSFRDRFFAKEQFLSNILDEELDVDPQDSMDQIADRIGNLEGFDDLERHRYASLLNLALNTSEERAEGLGDFGNIVSGGSYYSGIDDDARSELFDRLENEDLIEAGNETRYDLRSFLESELEEIVNREAETPDASDLKEDWDDSAFYDGYTSLGGILETAYEENEEQVANLAYLSEFLGEDLELDVQDWVEEQKQKKEAGEEYEIDGIEDIRNELENEIEEKQRELTLQAIKKLGEYDSVPALDREYRFTPFLSEEKEERRFIEFTGDEEDWESFREELEDLPINRSEDNGGRDIYRKISSAQLSEDFFGIPILNPDIDRIESWDDFQSIEEEAQSAIYAEFSDPESKLQEISEERENVRRYDFLAPRHRSQILSKLVEDTANEDDTKSSSIYGFGDTLRRLDDDVREEFFDLIKTETDEAVVEGGVNEHGREVEYSEGEDKFGNNLFDIAVNREYKFFVDDEEERIEDLLDSRGELPETDSFFEEDSPYKEIVDKLTSSEELENGEDSEYGEMHDEELAEKLRMVTGLGERLDFEYEASDVFGMLKGKEGQRQNTDFTPDEEEIESLLANRRKELEKDVQNKLREYVKQGVQNLGYEAVADKYEDATGERPDEVEGDELAALKIRQRLDSGDLSNTSTSQAIEMVDTLLKHQNEVYQREENQEWLEEHGFTDQELIDPDLSEQEDSSYQQPEDTDYRSALTVDIDEESVQMDTGAEKERYWEELTGLLGEAGIEQVEDVEDAEQALQELDKDDDSDIYDEAKDVIGNYKAVENRDSGVPDELTLRVADPMETTQMGRGFGSCHDVDGGTYAWASVSNAVDANKMVFYAEDEDGRERARVKGFITEDEELVYHNTSQYKDIDVNTSDYFEDYMSKVADNLGLDLKHSSEVSDLEENVELLEADDWYSGS